MKTLVHIAACLLMLWGACGCNSDVFVDNIQPSVSNLSLDGNGESATISFQSSDWNIWSIQTFSNGFRHIYKVYNENGNLEMTDYNPYLKGLGKIECDENMTSFTIERSNSKQIKITANENLRSSDFPFVIVAGNDYESQEIHVSISPSDRYVFNRISYSLDSYSHDMPLEEKNSMTINNNGNNPLLLHPMPYQGEHHIVTFASDSPEAFQLLGEQPIEIEIPTLNDGVLSMSHDKAVYSPYPQKLPLPFDNTVEKEISVPPHSSQFITLWLEYECFETAFTLYAIHPKTKKQRIITGTLKSKMPGKCYLTRKNLNE